MFSFSSTHRIEGVLTIINPQEPPSEGGYKKKLGGGTKKGAGRGGFLGFFVFLYGFWVFFFFVCNNGTAREKDKRLSVSNN